MRELKRASQTPAILLIERVVGDLRAPQRKTENLSEPAMHHVSCPWRVDVRQQTIQRPWVKMALDL